MPILNECTIKFDGIESALHERLGRRPEFVEVLQDYVSHDFKDPQEDVIAFLVGNRTRKEIV
jgi:hypothetical protein